MSKEKMFKKKILLSAVAFLVSATAVFLLIPTESAPRFGSSGNAALVPQSQIPFADYLAENRRRIGQVLKDFSFLPGQEPFRGDYSLEEVVAMRAPYEFSPAASCPNAAASHGILLIHGLSDSPYLTRQVAQELTLNFPCALVRGLLVPGHGTIPGDMRAVNRQDWRRIADYGVDSFAGQVETLTLVGYSNGSAIALDYLNRHPEQSLVSGLVLVVPGLGTASQFSWLTPWLSLVYPWLSRLPDTDAVKYESMATHAVAEFYHFTNEVISKTGPAIDVPLLIFLSGDESTVDNNRSMAYFCEHAQSDQSRLYVFAGDGGSVFSPLCERARVLDFDVDDPRFISFSHVALMLPPDDPHYGREGKYPICTQYLSNSERYNNCMFNAADTVYADATRADEDGLLRGKLIRRPTFNPKFEQMLEIMSCFIAAECRLPAAVNALEMFRVIR